MKYMGSKSRIKTDILKILQKLIDDNNIKTYIEPYDFKCIWEQEIIRTQDNRQRFKSIERMFMYEE